VTVTFDEIEAWNATPADGGYWITEEYADLGLHFVEGDYGWDGVVYDSGVGEFPATVDNSQFVGVASVHPDGGVGSGGLVMTFDTDQTNVSFQYVVADGEVAQMGGYWLFDDGVEVAAEFIPVGSDTYNFTGAMSSTGDFDKILFAVSLGATKPTAGAVDNLTFTETVVPIPASVLLLGTGLLPLLRLRRRS